MRDFYAVDSAGKQFWVGRALSLEDARVRACLALRYPGIITVREAETEPAWAVNSWPLRLDRF